VRAFELLRTSSIDLHDKEGAEAAWKSAATAIDTIMADVRSLRRDVEALKVIAPVRARPLIPMLTFASRCAVTYRIVSYRIVSRRVASNPLCNFVQQFATKEDVGGVAQGLPALRDTVGTTSRSCRPSALKCRLRLPIMAPACYGWFLVQQRSWR
jgi:hypothetical protein